MRCQTSGGQERFFATISNKNSRHFSFNIRFMTMSCVNPNDR